MEELLKSLEMPRDQYGSRHNIRRIPVGTRRTATDKINYLRVEPVPLNKAVLRQNRILTGQEPALFRESYQLLRTQTLQRLKDNHWNVLGVTSPCASEGKTVEKSFEQESTKTTENINSSVLSVTFCSLFLRSFSHLNLTSCCDLALD